MKFATLPQAIQILQLLKDKKVPSEQITELLRSGLLADLFESDPGGVKRDAVRKACMLKPLIKPFDLRVASAQFYTKGSRIVTRIGPVYDKARTLEVLRAADGPYGMLNFELRYFYTDGGFEYESEDFYFWDYLDQGGWEYGTPGYRRLSGISHAIALHELGKSRVEALAPELFEDYRDLDLIFPGTLVRDVEGGKGDVLAVVLKTDEWFIDFTNPFRELQPVPILEVALRVE